MFWCFYHFLENKKSTRKSQPILADYDFDICDRLQRKADCVVFLHIFVKCFLSF